MQAKEIWRSVLPLNYEKGRLTCNTPINVMGPHGPTQYHVDWKVTWDVNTPVVYRGKNYTVEGYELSHDNHGAIWPDIVLKDTDDLLLRVDPIASMNDHPMTWVHNLETVEQPNVEIVENVEFTDSQHTTTFLDRDGLDGVDNHHEHSDSRDTGSGDSHAAPLGDGY